MALNPGMAGLKYEREGNMSDYNNAHEQLLDSVRVSLAKIERLTDGGFQKASSLADRDDLERERRSLMGGGRETEIKAAILALKGALSQLGVL